MTEGCQLLLRPRGLIILGQKMPQEAIQLLNDPIAKSTAIVAVTAIVTVGLVRLARSIIRKNVSDGDLRYRTAKFVGMFGYFVMFVVIVTELSGRITSLTVAIGAASAGIAFALQEVIVSFAGWLAVAFGAFFKVGDRVQLGGIRGDVIDIGFLRTTLMECGSWVNADLYNGRIVRVANSFVFKEPVFNYSGEFPFLWDEITIPVRYESDYAEARRILDEIAAAVVGDYTQSAKSRWQELVRSYRIEDARVDPQVTLIANDNWVKFTLRYVVDYRKRRSTKDALFTRILEAIENTEGRVRLASATLALVEAPTLGVRIHGAELNSRSSSNGDSAATG